MTKLEEYKQLSESISDIFNDVNKRKKLNGIDESYEMLSTQYGLLKEIFEVGEEVDKQYACREAIKNTLRWLVEMMKSPKVEVDKIEKIYVLYNKVFAFCGRRSLHHFILHMESDRTEARKVYFNRQEILAPAVFYLNKIAFDEKFKILVMSYYPGAGKSFLLNYFTAWTFGLSNNNSILRLSYSDELLNGFSRAIKELITSERFSDVFTEFTRFNGKPFEKEKDSDWKIRGADVMTSHYVRTRDGATTGVRAKFGILFDDMTKGAEEAYNDDLHNGYWQKYTTEWWNRRESDRVKYIFAGTMWSPKDLLNRVTDKESALSKAIPSSKFKYVWETEDGHAAFIRVPLLDENENSTCESIMSTKEARELKNVTEPFLFSCVYQQDPIAPTGMEFALENLRTFDVLPDKSLLQGYCKAVLDPTRRGKDNISMPIFKVSADNEDHYLIDVLFRQKAMTEVYEDIVNHIIQHDIVNFVIENNTDTSLKTLLDDRLKAKGYTLCNILEKFNTVKKEIRIKDARGIILRKIVFKEKHLYTPNSDYGRFMESFTRYSFDYANKHDDAPDSLALYVTEIIENRPRYAKLEYIDRGKLGI